MDTPLVSAVMPCLNEAETLGVCVTKALACFRASGIAGEVVVADNGSTDNSVAVAESLGARVVHVETRGYGAALTAGIEAARGDIIVMGDSDDSYDWEHIEPFIRRLEEGFDLVMGNRFQGGIEPGAMPALHRYLGNPVLSAIARVASGAKVGDFHCGMRAFTKAAFRQMSVATTGMEFASEMVINAARNGLRITEIPTKLYRDKRSRPPHLRSFRDGWRHLRFIMTYAPDYVFIGPGLMMMAVGVVLQAILARGPARVFGLPLGIHFLALGSLLTLAGYNVLNLGVMGKVVMAVKYPRLKSRVVSGLLTRFSLEAGLTAGGVLCLIGLLADGVILLYWLRHLREPMESTVHLAFVASTTVVLGVNLIFSSFLVHLTLSEEKSLR